MNKTEALEVIRPKGNDGNTEVKEKTEMHSVSHRAELCLVGGRRKEEDIG